MAAAHVVGLRLAGLVAVAAMLAACGHGGPGREATAAGIAQAAGLEAGTSKGAVRDLQIYRRDDGKPGPLFVYIEGDGLAYLDARTPSTDPTPADPLALRLAAADPGPAGPTRVARCATGRPAGSPRTSSPRSTTPSPPSA